MTDPELPTPVQLACDALDHPGVTFNDREDRTWCRCGLMTYPGDVAEPHMACCGGPLDIGPDGMPRARS